MFERGVSFTPAAAPAGRAWENWPVTNTRLPDDHWSHTTPLICTVGSAAAETVSGVRDPAAPCRPRRERPGSRR